MSAAAVVGCCLPGPSLYTSPRDDDGDRITRARSGSDSDSSESWLPNKAALPQCSARFLAAFLFVTSVTFTTAAASGITATGSVHRRGQARAVHRSRLARSERGQKSTCFESTHLLQPAFGCAAAAAAPRRVMSRWGRRHWTNDLGRRRPCSAALTTGRNGVSAPPSMDSGDLDAMVQTMAPPTSAPINTGVSLNPAQEACALLDPETPAILLTAGAGTGKTHTLAARLAYLLGVKIRRPALGEQKEGAVAAGDIGRLDRTDWLAGVFAGGGGMGEASAHAAAPENVLVLSFTHQGVQDVRDRAVAAGLPRAQGDRVWAATFHSFAATVLKQNANLVWPNPASAGPIFSKGVDIIGRTEQVDLLATALAGPKENVDLPPPTGGTFLSATGGAFEGTWSGSDGLGGSWGMPPSSEERGEEAARRRKASATRAKAVLSRLTLWKEQGLTPEDVRDGKAEIADETDKAAAGVYSRYQGLLRSRGQVDFGDLCMMATDLFVRHPEVLERYRWRLRHVLVDEYQDTSPAQQRLLKALVLGTPSVATAAGDKSAPPPPPTSLDPATARRAGEAEEAEEGGAWGKGGARAGVGLDKHPGLGVSLFCTGDEDQHIYGWRGTTVDHLHSFEEDFPGAVRCALTETHRLPVHLLRSSTGLMRAGGLVPLLNNRMKTRQNTGAVVRAQGLWNSREEGKWVAVEARKMHREQGISYKDMAVISRTAFNTRELEESLAARGVPYTVEGGSSFFSRSEVQAPLALLALCANPQDDAAFRRVISLRLQSRLLRWATPATMRGVGELAVAEGVSFAEAVRLSVSRGQVEGGDASTFIYGLRRWSSLLMGWPKLHDVERGAAVWRIFSEAGFLPPSGENIFASLGGSMGGGGAGGGAKMTQDEESIGQLATAASRCDHIGRFLLRAARAREEAAEKQGARKRGGTGGRWEGTTGNGEQRTSRRSEDSLEMMTMHQAKGREFKVVFLTGWDEGSFPLLPSTGDRNHVVESLERLHEERRLGYVALTRASQNAIITFSKKRRFRNSWVHSSGPSRFLLDMPTEFVEVLPDAIGRALNDYPGLAGSHTLAFDGLVQAGKLRRSRPVLPPDSEMRALQSSPRHRENGGDTLPPGCTIVNRNDGFGDANTNSKSLLTTSKVISSSDTGTRGTDTPTTDTKSTATAVAAAAVGAAAAVAAATENSSLADFAESRLSSADTLSADPSAPAELPQRQSFGDKQAGDDFLPAAPRPSGRNPSSASPEDVVVSAAPTGTIDTGDVPGGMTAMAAPVRLEAPTKMGNSVELEATRREPMSGPRQKEGATTTTTVVTQPPPPPPPRLVGAGTVEGLTRVLYNPGPTFRRARGRKKKTLLDASRVTADDTIGSEKVLALVADPTIQQASLKNYLRAVLAIQHGCVRGSIPVSRPSGGKPSKEAPATARKAASRGGLAEKGATGRAALSMCSAHELASYIVVLLDAREKE